jgi:hypothetical protein
MTAPRNGRELTDLGAEMLDRFASYVPQSENVFAHVTSLNVSRNQRNGNVQITAVLRVRVTSETRTLRS